MRKKGRKPPIPKPAALAGISLKKKHGQNFLCDDKYLRCIFDSVTLSPASSVFEIGGGAGFLTKAILEHELARLWVFEIDEEWVTHLQSTISDPRLTVYHENILDVDFSKFDEHQPWTLIANLPYHVTFPILQRMQKHRALLTDGVVMVQEEVAQKIVATRGRGYGYVSLFYQHYFEWKLLDKVPPSAFYPPPKVDSRLMYFKPRPDVTPIPDEEGFWKFIKVCFKQPRRTLRNNLAGAHYVVEDEALLAKRAQQLSMSELLVVWEQVRHL